MHDAPPDGPFVDLDEAARRLRIGPESVQAALERGMLPGRRDAQGRWRVALGDTEAPKTKGGGQSASRATASDDQVGWLRTELARRDGIIAEKDGLIAELTRRIASFGEQALARIPTAPVPAQRAETLSTSHPDPTLRQRQQEGLQHLRDSLIALKQRLNGDD